MRPAEYLSVEFTVANTDAVARTGVLRCGDLRVARYDGWLRTDVPARVRIRIPGLARDAEPFDATLSGRAPAKIDAR